jgi:acetate---CoA ligase (ADP-forming)
MFGEESMSTITERPAFPAEEVPDPAAATAASLRPLFRPRSVAVIGASRDPGRIGRRMFDALLQGDFQGPVFPINPHVHSLQGVRAYPSVQAAPEAVDLAIIAVPPSAVLAAVEDCAARGVPAVVVITAGFAEVGAGGEGLQAKVLEKVRAAGMRMVGPNCLGLINTAPDVSLNATFIPVNSPRGRVAMSSDSGALSLALLTAAARLGLGVSSCVSIGNRADVSTNDLLEYWEQDEDTGVILLYLESFGNPRRFARIARRVGRTKPIVAVKAGRTRAGRRGASSHTAALAASDVAVEALFQQTGVIRAETLEEMLDLASALSSQPLPTGNRVAVLTDAGGPAVLCADACEAGGLVLPELSEKTRGELAAFLPASAGLSNPVDMIASATLEQFRQAVEILLGSGEVDALVTIAVCAGALTVEGVGAAIREGLTRARAHPGPSRPVLACLMGEKVEPQPLGRGQETIPCYAFPEEPARVLAALAAHARWRAQPPGTIPSFSDIDFPSMRALCRQALERGTGWLGVEETRALLKHLGLPVCPGGVAHTPDEAAALARSLGFPVAVKLASHQIVHKTEMGGVCLHVPDEGAVIRAFEEIRDRLEREGRLDALEGVLVQPMVSGGTEVLVGLTQDPLFGPLIAFGLGGIHVEVLGDVCLRVTPLTDRDAAEMVRSIKGYRLLQGYRGHPPGDVAALEEILLRVSCLAQEFPEVVELDLNPVFALQPGKGCYIVDARLRVGQAAADTRK